MILALRVNGIDFIATGHWTIEFRAVFSMVRKGIRKMTTYHHTRRWTMKAIVVTDQAAGTAGMKLMDRPEPKAAINDVVVQVHASGFVPTELAWPSTSPDRRDRARTPSSPGHELAGV